MFLGIKPPLSSFTSCKCLLTWSLRQESIWLIAFSHSIPSYFCCWELLMTNMRKLCLQQETDPLGWLSPCPTYPSPNKERQPCQRLFDKEWFTKSEEIRAFKNFIISLQKKRELTLIEQLLSATHYFRHLKIISLIKIISFDSHENLMR